MRLAAKEEKTFAAGKKSAHAARDSDHSERNLVWTWTRAITYSENECDERRA